MSPSLTFSPRPRIQDLDTCSTLKHTDDENGQQLSSALGNVKIEILHRNCTETNSNTVCVNCINNHLNSNAIITSSDESKGNNPKFSKLTKVKGYFRQIGLFVLDLFIAFFCYICGIILLFNVLIAAGFSWTLRLFVRLIFATCYHPGQFKLIERGADALWAVETGFGASNSNIVIGLKCKGRPDLDKIVRVFESKVLNFKTKLRVKKVNGSYLQEECGETYEPYQKLKWIIVEKFLFFCMKKDVNFCTKNHFLREEIEDEENEDLNCRMRKVMEKCITTRMSQDKPQWKFTIISKSETSLTRVPAEEQEYGMIFTIHHSYGDGISWVQMFRYAFADHPVKASIDPMGKSPSLSSHYYSSSEHFATRALRWCQTVLLLPHYFSRQMVYVWRETNFFHGPYVKNNCVCMYSSLSMKQIKGIRIPTAASPPSTNTPVGASAAATAETLKSDFRIGVNHNELMSTMVVGSTKPVFTALLSACITAAFTRLFRDYNSRVPGNVLAILPYADLPYTTLHPLNNFYSHFLPIPTSVTNSRARLVECDKYTKSFNPPPTKPVNTLMAHLCGIMIAPLQKMVGISARSTIGFSNVPGPAERINLFGGDEVTSLILFPPLKYRTAIVVGFISYGDQLQMSICVDETIQNHTLFASRFIQYFQEELQNLIDLNKQVGISAAAHPVLDPSSAIHLLPASPTPLKVQSDETRGGIIISKKSLIIDELDRSHSDGASTTTFSPNSSETSAATSRNQRDFVVTLSEHTKGFPGPGRILAK